MNKQRYSLNRLFFTANKILVDDGVKWEKCIAEDNGEYKCYFVVGQEDRQVTLTVKKLNDKTHSPFKKEFSCDCDHCSIQGLKNEIICIHIIAVISWLTTVWKGSFRLGGENAHINK